MRTLLLLAVLAAAPADDALTRYGIAPQALRDGLFNGLTRGELGGLSLRAPLRAIDASARVAAVKVFGAFARNYASSDDFKKRYADWRASNVGKPPVPPRSAAEVVKAHDAEMDESLARARETMKGAPPEAQAQMAAALEQAKAANAGLLANPEVLAQSEKERFEAENTEYQAKAALSPERPEQAIKLALKKFLEQSADVDFAAKTQARDGLIVFVNDTNEARSPVWKDCFRAGREPTQAARAFAKEWLSALK